MRLFSNARRRQDHRLHAMVLNQQFVSVAFADNRSQLVSLPLAPARLPRPITAYHPYLDQSRFPMPRRACGEEEITLTHSSMSPDPFDPFLAAVAL